MRAYLRALAELTKPPGSLRLVSLNDPAIDASALQAPERAALVLAEGCRRRKARRVLAQQRQQCTAQQGSRGLLIALRSTGRA